MKRLLSFFVILFTSAVLWAQNNVITYTAAAKLTTTTDSWTSGLHTNAFNVSISSHTFSNGVGTIIFSGTVATIGSWAFYGCSGLTSITIPSSVTSIGYDAFSGCSGLTSITIPSSVTSIGYGAFSGCSGLTSITIPEGVTSIGSAAFEDCSSLTSITIPSSVTSIENYAFSDCSGLTSIVWNSTNCASPSQYSYSPFYDIRTQITSFTIGNEVSTIPNCLCYGMNNLNSITIPEGVTSIGNYAFEDCSGLTSITIPEGVTSIGSSTFEDCSSLTSITIPSSVTSIGNYAFDGCSSLTSITSLAKTPPSLSIYSFSGVDKTIPLMVPCGNIGDYYWANGWSEFTNIVDDCNKVVLTIQSLNPSMGSVTTGGEYSIGTHVTISATPSHGFQFSAWSDGNTDNPRMVELISDTTFTAVFDSASFAVSKQHTPVAGGLIEGPDSVLYMHEGTYTAIANEGYLFEAWSDGTTANPRTITVMGDTTILALFIRYEKVIVHDTTYIDRVDTIEMITATSMDPITGEARLLVQAVPADGYEFFCWSDFNTDNPRVVDVSDGEPKVYTAVFRAKVNTAMREESAPATYTQTYDILGRKVDSDHHGLKVSAQGKTIGK